MCGLLWRSRSRSPCPRSPAWPRGRRRAGGRPGARPTAATRPSRSLRTAALDTPAEREAVARRLGALGVEAQLGPTVVDAKIATDQARGRPQQRPQPRGHGGQARPRQQAGAETAGFQQGLEKTRLDDYRQSAIALPQVAGLLWVPRESPATRLAIALGAGLAALGAALVVIVVLLRRWVLQPLARLAADAERIAGGELDVEPLPTRAREVAQVGDALHGMAGALGDALQPRPQPSASAASWSRRSPTTCARRSSRCADRSRGSSAASATSATSTAPRPRPRTSTA